MEIENKKNKTFEIASDLTLNHSDLLITHIEFCDKSKDELNKPKDEHKETWKDKLSGLVLVGIIIFILISILVGAITIIGWLF